MSPAPTITRDNHLYPTINIISCLLQSSKRRATAKLMKRAGFGRAESGGMSLTMLFLSPLRISSAQSQLSFADEKVLVRLIVVCLKRPSQVEQTLTNFDV